MRQPAGLISDTRMDDPHVKKWVEEYQAEFGEFPGTGALLGRSSAEGLVMALEAAGPDLTAESFLKAQEGLNYVDPITGVTIDYGPDATTRAVTPSLFRSIEGGDWQVKSARK